MFHNSQLNFGDDMDYRNVIFLLVVSLLLFGVASAQKTVNDFQIDESYNHAYNGTYNSLYLNDKHDAGIGIFKNAAGDVDDDHDAYGGFIQDDGRAYITADDDMKIDRNSDNTVNFTDCDHAEHGAAEVITVDGDEYIVVFWAKDTSDVSDSDLIFQLSEFNEDNDVKAVSF